MKTRYWLAALAAVGACGKGKQGTQSGSAAVGSGAPSAAAGSSAAVGSGSAGSAVQAGSATDEAPPQGAGSAATASPRDPARAQAANTRGMQLLAAKKYKEAMAEFEAAIAADDRYVLAHYNLACAASRAHDRDVARRELIWVQSAAAWSGEAMRATAKAAKDPDLAWFLGLGLESASFAGGGPMAEDLLQINCTPATVAPDVAKLVASAPGKHDDQCDPNDPKQGRMHALALDGTKRVIYASLRDGVAVVEDSKSIASRTEPLGCTGPGASQDDLTALCDTAVSSFGPEGLANHDLVIARYFEGGRRSWTDNVAVFAFKDGNHLVLAFDATLATNEDRAPGTLELTSTGELALGQPGAKQKRVFHWNRDTSTFEEVKQ